MQNQEIAKIFEELATLLEIQDENPFKIRAYKNAANIIKNLPYSLEEMIKQGKDLTKIPGIGEKIAQKIKEIITTKKLSKLEELRKKIPDSILTLLSIEGLGPKRVKILYEKLHITDPESLQQAAKEHKISKLPGFGKKIEKKILEGLHLLKQEGVRYLYAEVEPIVKDIIFFLKQKKELLQISPAGSFRRCKESVADIDILATSNDPIKIINHFKTYPKIAKIISAGETRSTIILQNALQVDLRVLDKSYYGSALLYFTGSKAHSVALRTIANDLGYKLNEYGLYKNDTLIVSKTENEIYQKLNLAFIEPELRENRGEIEAAKNNTLPNLVNQKEIKGDLHMHTTYSDGTNTIEEMVQYAIKLGYHYIAITDHSNTLAITQGLDTKKAFEQFQEIDKLNQKYKPFKILKGMEVDILEDGSLGTTEEILKQLDIAIGAIHTKFNLSKKEQTKRLITAIKNPYIKGIAHPTARLIGKRKAIELDIKEIFKAAKEENTFFEINSQPQRLDLNDILIKEAKSYGIKFSISSDAHSTFELNYIKYGINQARRGWLEKKDIINTSEKLFL